VKDGKDIGGERRGEKRKRRKRKNGEYTERMKLKGGGAQQRNE